MQQALTSTTHTNQSEMLNPFKSTLRSLYPEKDGWKLYNRFNWATKVFDYVLQKEEDKTIYRILVELNLENTITKDHFDKLDNLAVRLDNGKCSLTQKIMIIDDSAKLEHSHSQTEIVLLSNLFNMNLLSGGFDKSKLVA